MYGKPTEGICRVCGGQIFEIIVRELDLSPGPLIMGPSSKQQQYHEASKGFHCTRCGIKYQFVPQTREQEKCGHKEKGEV